MKRRVGIIWIYYEIYKKKRVKKDNFYNYSKTIETKLLLQRHVHTFRVLSTLPVTTILPFISIVLTKWSWAFYIFLKHLPLLRSHILTLLSSLDDKRYFPFGWKTRSVTQLSWPTKVITHLQFLTSQIFIVLSLDAEAR